MKGIVGVGQNNNMLLNTENIKIRYPILNFLVSFIVFIIIYSMISVLFNNLSFNFEVEKILIIKRIAQGFLYLAFIIFLHNKNSVNYDYFGSINIKTLIIVVLIMFSLYFLYENTIQILIDKYFSYKMFDSTNSIESIFSNPIAAFLQVCITAPIVEEVLIRGYFFKTLNGRYTVLKTIIITSIFFAVLHFDFVNTIFYLIIGIFLGIVFVRTKSIGYCIILHFSLNFYAFISYYI